jgi:hypothetical protein
LSIVFVLVMRFREVYGRAFVNLQTFGAIVLTMYHVEYCIETVRSWRFRDLRP